MRRSLTSKGYDQDAVGLLLWAASFLGLVLCALSALGTLLAAVFAYLAYFFGAACVACYLAGLVAFSWHRVRPQKQGKPRSYVHLMRR